MLLLLLHLVKSAVSINMFVLFLNVIIIFIRHQGREVHKIQEIKLSLKHKIDRHTDIYNVNCYIKIIVIIVIIVIVVLCS